MDGEYFTFNYPPTGDLILFCRTPDGSIFSRVDDSFAHANGFADLAEMKRVVSEGGGGELPEWMLWHSELMSQIPMN